jgi:ornithine--oxo-acid transaminase
MSTNEGYIELDKAHAAHNYHPLPVVAATAEGSWITDVEGTRYLDLLSAYSAMNFGHGNQRLVDAAKQQLDRVTLTSRAIHNDQMGALCRDLSELAGMETALLMNSGAEGVETAIKLARKWGYEKKGVPQDTATIIVAGGNFHGRTISIISFSDNPDARGNFGPYTPGFISAPYGDASAIGAVITGSTVAVLIEPIQGEGGVIIPPDGYLEDVRAICTEENVLFIADEIQSGLGRTGKTFACDHEDVKPDIYILGKALGGGIMPLSAVVTRWDIMEVIRPGEHGSTFGGNPLACAIGTEVLSMLATGELQKRARHLGDIFRSGLDVVAERTGAIRAVRSRGLWAGIDIADHGPTGREVSERLLERRVIAKNTHGHTIRFAPPLTISEEDLLWGIDQIEAVLADRVPVESVVAAQGSSV